MKLQVDEDRTILLTEVFTGISLKADEGETFGICMRDGGFEFCYGGVWYSAKNGKIKELMSKSSSNNSEEEVKQTNQKAPCSIGEIGAWCTRCLSALECELMIEGLKNTQKYDPAQEKDM